MNKWSPVKLGKIVESGGGTIHTGPFGSQLHASDYVESGIPCVMPANMKDNRVDLSGIAFISQQDATRLSKYLVQKGDILYSRRGDVTLKALIRENEVGYFCGTGCLLLRPGNKINPDFLTYYLSTSTMKEWISSQAVGATMPNLNTGILARVPFAAPEKDTQQKIAAVLSALDAKIDCNKRINAELEAMAKTLYDYWFVQFDFPISKAQAQAMGKPALEGKPYKSSGGKMEYNKVLKRDIPAGWEVDVASTILSFNPCVSLKQESTAAYIDMDALPTHGYMTKRVQQKEFISGTKFTNGDVLFARITPCLENGKTGVVSLLDDKEVGFGSTEFIVIRGKKQTLTGYCAFLARSDYFRKFAITNMTGTSGRKRIEANVLETISLPIPPDSLLTQFEKICTPVFRQLTINTMQSLEITKLRDWLLPMLMNGQVTVA